MRVACLISILLFNMQTLAEDRCSKVFSKKTDIQNTNSSRLNRQKRDTESYFYSRNANFVKDAYEDFSELRKKGDQVTDVDKYYEFNDIFSLLKSNNKFFRNTFKQLAEDIIQKERSERYYKFREFHTSGSLPQDTILFKTFRLGNVLFQKNKTSKEEHIENSVVNTVRKNGVRMFTNLKDVDESILDGSNLVGQVLWRLKEDKALHVLQSLYEVRNRVGSYYYALARAEDYFKDEEQDIRQVSDILNQTLGLLVTSIIKDNPADKPYYQDKLMKILPIVSYFNKESVFYLKQKIKNANESLAEIYQPDVARYRHHFISSTLFYLILTKYSQSENIIEKKYGLTAHSADKWLEGLERKIDQEIEGKAEQRARKEQQEAEQRVGQNAEYKAEQNNEAQEVFKIDNVVTAKAINSLSKQKESLIGKQNDMLEENEIPAKDVESIVRNFERLESKRNHFHPSFLLVKNKNLARDFEQGMEVFGVTKDIKESELRKKAEELGENIDSFMKRTVLTDQEENQILNVTVALTSELGHSSNAWQALARNIINLERSERYYIFKENAYFLPHKMTSTFLKDVGRTESRVLDNYQETTSFLMEQLRELNSGGEKGYRNYEDLEDKVSAGIDAVNDYREKYKTNIFDFANRFAQIGWKANLTNSKKFLNMLYNNKSAMGSYYYALTLFEEYFKDRDAIIPDELIRVFEVTFDSLLYNYFVSSGSARKGYYLDKLMKTIILDAYLKHELFLKERSKNIMSLDQENKKYCVKKCRKHLTEIEGLVIMYLMFSKLSGSEDIFKEKYRLTSEGVHLDDLGAKLPRVILLDEAGLSYPTQPITDAGIDRDIDALFSDMSSQSREKLKQFFKNAQSDLKSSIPSDSKDSASSDLEDTEK